MGTVPNEVIEANARYVAGFGDKAVKDVSGGVSSLLGTGRKRSWPARG